MGPLVVLTAVFAAACAAPSNIALGHHAYAGPAVAVAAAPAVAVHAAPALATHVPAPYSTSAVQGVPLTAHSKAPAVITKQLHYGSKDFVSGYSSSILKPAIPDFRIAVPTALKGTHQVNPAIVKTAVETHVVNEPVAVPRRVDVPYDVPIVREQLVDVPRPVHVERPYAVHVPTPVRGEDIVQYKQTAPIIQRTHSHHHTAAAPVAVGYAHGAVAAPAAVGYAGYAHGAVAAPAAVGYAGYGAVAAPAGLGYANVAGLGYAHGAGLGYAHGAVAAPVAAIH